MTDVIIIIVLLILIIIALNSAKKRLKGGCCGSGGGTIKIKPTDRNKSHYPHKSLVYIDGMTCEHCQTRIENAFNSMPDCFATVNLKKKYAQVLSKSELNEKQISDLITEKGYTFVKLVREK